MGGKLLEQVQPKMVTMKMTMTTLTKDVSKGK